MNSGQGDNLVSLIPRSNPTFYKSHILTTHKEEAVSENLKNMLLVMSNGGYLAPPSGDSHENPKQEALWNETWKRINRFQPNLFAELFPEEAGKPQKPKVSKDEKREVERKSGEKSADSGAEQARKSEATDRKEG